jgi:protease PrsW
MMAPPVAAALGAAGGLFAQFLTVAQRDLFGIATNGTFLHDLGYYAGIVAPRDTILQMILFVPFLPLLLRRKSGLDTMVVTGCVGLGFAIVGNLELCKQLPPADSLGRLLTANFFHFAGAALIGLCVCRCLARERGAASATMGTLLAVMLTQGVYDAFTRISGAHVLMILATIAFLIVSRVFFMELRKWRDSFTDQCFLGATLVISLGLMVATVLVTVAAESGLENASWALLRNLPTLLMVSVVFFGQFKRGFAPIGSDLTVPRYS